MPSENTTTCQGAPFNTLDTDSFLLANAVKINTNAPMAAIRLMGTPLGSSTKNPTNKAANTAQPVTKVALSLMTLCGLGKLATSYVAGMSF